MAHIHKRIEIKAPVEKVYSYIDDPKNSPEWITNMIEVNDVTGTGVDRHFNWVWNMSGMKFKGESTNVQDVPNKHITLKSKGGIEATWDYKFESKKDVTILDLDIDYNVPVPVLGKLAEKMILKHNERDAEMALGNLKDKLES